MSKGIFGEIYIMWFYHVYIHNTKGFVFQEL